MAHLRFQTAVCLAAAAMTAFDGLVVLWPDQWRKLEAGDASGWGSMLYLELVLFGPVLAVFLLRHNVTSRIICCVLLLFFLVFVGRFYSIQTDPYFDHDLIFLKIDPILLFHIFLFCLPCWLCSLIVGLFMLWRRRQNGIEIRDA